MLIGRINIQAPENSPHTDGIHIANSNNIQILNSEISAGDDCASMGPGSQNVNISSNVKIWPSNVESASIRSLRGTPNEKEVREITVQNCNLKGTSNGVRIKT